MLNLAELYSTIAKAKDWYSPRALREIRRFHYILTQREFSNLIGVNQRTYEQWESGRVSPPSAARSLLLIVRDYPEIFLKNREKIIRTFLNEKNRT
jgi:DNA-binding transcriptional regulator YiaG